MDAITGLLFERAPQGWEEEEGEAGVLFRVHLPAGPYADELADAVAELWPGTTVAKADVPNEDWALAWRDFFTPVRAGRFLVLPPWLTPEPGDDAMPLVIDPGTAFGTGHHATTALCLELLSEAPQAAPGNAFLDLGTGTGLLGLACVALGMTGRGLDIDPLAIENARRNRRLNKAENGLDLATGSLELVRSEQFQVVLANILAGPLRDMAGELASRVAPGGALILSGILAGQAHEVAAAYRAQGLGEPLFRPSGEWMALAWL